MCIIVDINVAHKTLTASPDPDFKPVHSRLFDRRNLTLVVGGELLSEYQKDRRLIQVVIELDRAGVAQVFGKREVDAETIWVRGTGLCVSDDPHLVALARVSGARVLCSYDQRAHTDFGNKALIDNPRGKIYQNPGHEHLLDACPRCRTK